MIALDDIEVGFDGPPVLSGLSLTIGEGEFFTLLGPSGCGKTTLLRTISGFVTPQRGRVTIDGQDVTRKAPEDRGIGVVFQNYALFPHLDVFENVAFGLRVAGIRRAEIGKRVEAALERIGVSDHARMKPAELSGGQQQRVAIARALILGARVLLLDEPLSNLDAKLRETMRDEIRDIQQRLGLTAIYVTHDQHEALALSDRIAVMNGGKLTQIGPPRDLYDRPATPFVCRFIGESSRLPPAAGVLPPGRSGEAYVRPEDIHLAERAGDGWVTLRTHLERTVFQGPRVRLVLRHDEHRLLVDVPAHETDAVLPGDVVPVSVHASRIHVYEEAGQ